jgi:hypothetical protein
MSPTLPPFDKNVNLAPHVVLLGAGASIAAYRDWGSVGPQLPSMLDLIGVLGLSDDIERHGYKSKDLNFEDFYDGLSSAGNNTRLQHLVEERVYSYFSSLTLPPTPTIYDYLVLSLRRKDIIASFNWDPFLLEALMRNAVVAGAQRPRLAFLHGNVRVGICARDRVSGLMGGHCSVCSGRFTHSKLLYPVRSKDYASDPFIKGEWDALRWHLRHGYYLTVFGYGAPKTDAEARNLILKDWKANKSLELCEVDVIDTKPRDEIEANWDEFFYSHHYSVTDSIWSSYVFNQPRRTCDAFASATLMNSPWDENPFPRFTTLLELQAWVAPLVTEELAYEKDSAPFSGKPLPPNAATGPK